MKLDFKYFDPNIVLDFQPEGPGNEVTDFDNFMFACGEYKDLASALSYAESDIIPVMRVARENQFKDITPQILITFIKTLHQITAKTLAADHQEHVGEYSTCTIFRWHQRAQMQDDLSEKYQNDLGFESVFKEYGLMSIAKDFNALFFRMQKDEAIEEKEDKRAFYAKLRTMLEKLTLSPTPEIAKCNEFDRVMHKIADAYHQNKLTDKEKKTLSEMVKICMPPEQIAEAMENFAKTLLSKLIACDGKLQSVTKLAAETYSEFAGVIHPFFNANGRTGTQMINIILLIFGYPSITLRDPNDKDDPTSSYSKAIQSLEINPNDVSVLQKHILARVKKAIYHQAKPITPEHLCWGRRQCILQQLDLYEKIISMQQANQANIAKEFQIQLDKISVFPTEDEYRKAFNLAATPITPLAHLRANAANDTKKGNSAPSKKRGKTRGRG